MKESQYKIIVNFSEPQIIDMQKVFYIESKENEPRRRKSVSFPLRKSFTKEMEIKDSILTSKIQKGENFETIWNEVHSEH